MITELYVALMTCKPPTQQMLSSSTPRFVIDGEIVTSFCLFFVVVKLLILLHPI